MKYCLFYFTNIDQWRVHNNLKGVGALTLSMGGGRTLFKVLIVEKLRFFQAIFQLTFGLELIVRAKRAKATRECSVRGITIS